MACPMAYSFVPRDRYGDVPRSLNSEVDLAAADAQDSDGDVGPDDQRFARSAGESQQSPTVHAREIWCSIPKGFRG